MTAKATQTHSSRGLRHSALKQPEVLSPGFASSSEISVASPPRRSGGGGQVDMIHQAFSGLRDQELRDHYVPPGTGGVEPRSNHGHPRFTVPGEKQQPFLEPLLSTWYM